jgi:CheY-like chemotaxis protein
MKSGVWQRAPAACACGLEVLVAEDDAALRGAIARAIRETGHTVIEFADGGALIAYLRWARQDAQPRFLVTDLNMPLASGLEALAELRCFDPDVRSIVITAFPDERALRVSRALGAVALFAKPFELDDLCSAVQFLGHAPLTSPP